MDNNFQQELFWKSFRTSAATHALIAIAAVLMSLTLARDPVKVTPSIRVDLVALPDLMKKDLANIDLNNLDDLSQKLSDGTKDTKKSIEKMKKDAAKPAPVVPKEPEPKVADDSMAMKKTKPLVKNKKQDLKSAIDRIKALSDIENEVKKAPAKKVVLKGNALSKGNSVTGETGTDVNAYVGQMQSKLRENWNLPVWLSKQNLNAKVVLFLDRGGYVAKTVMAKSSGDKQFDDFVLKTIKISQPFGPPPADILDAGLTLGFPL